MTLNSRTSPFLFSLLFASGLLLLASILPFWTVAMWKDTGKRGPASFLEAVQFARTRGDPGGRFGQPHPHLDEVNDENIRTTAIVLVVCVVAGVLTCLIVRAGCPRAEEKQGG